MKDLARREEGGTTDDATSRPVLTRLRAHGVAIEKSGEVGTYLSAHPEVGRDVERLSRAARERLGPETMLTLALVRDPDSTLSNWP